MTDWRVVVVSVDDDEMGYCWMLLRLGNDELPRHERLVGRHFWCP